MCVMKEEKAQENKKNKGSRKGKKTKKGFDFEAVRKKLEELKKESSVPVSVEEDNSYKEYRGGKGSVSNWYAIRCISGREKKVRRYLLAELERLGFKDYVEDIIIPIVKAYRNIKGRRQVYEKSLMPGYLLYKGVVTMDIVQAVNSTTDVVGFVGSSKTKLPSPLNSEEVNRILSALYSDVDVSVGDSMSFFPGEVVRITDGPFEGFEGRVEEVDSKRKRLRVMTNIFGRPTLVDLNFIQVQKVKS